MLIADYKKQQINFLAIIFSLLFLLFTPTIQFAQQRSTQEKNYAILILKSNCAQNKKSRYGVRTGNRISRESLPRGPKSYYSPDVRSSFPYMSPDNFKQAFQGMPSEYDILDDYELYAFSGFRIYARTLHSYQDFMLMLDEHIKSDKNFRKATANMPGFEYKFHFSFKELKIKEKSGFHDFVHQEAERIREHQKRIPSQLSVANADLEYVKVSFSTWHDQHDQELKERYQRRSTAIKKIIESGGACFDYSIQVEHFVSNDHYADIFNYCYGTALDQQLHQELCDIRSRMQELQAYYPESSQIKTIAPVVHHFAALAKVQTNPEIAFHLSDCCHYLNKTAQVLVQGIEKGVVNLIEHNIAFFKSFVHPIDEIIKPLYQASLSLGQAILAAKDLAIRNPTAFKTKSKETIYSVGKFVYNRPEETIATIVECLLPMGICHVAKLKNVQHIVNAIKTHEWYVQACSYTSDIVKKLTIPLKTCLSEAATIVRTELEYGKTALKNVIQVAEQQPVTTSVGDIVALKVPSEYLNNVEQLSQTVGCKTVDHIIHKIRNIGDDILDIMEKTGGHTLERHIGQANSELVRRAMQDGVGAASSFTNKRTAINAIKENLRHNAKEIAEWLRSNPAVSKSFDFYHKYPIGEGVPHGKKCLNYDLMRSRIVLKADPANTFGFKIVTAFPIVI